MTDEIPLLGPTETWVRPWHALGAILYNDAAPYQLPKRHQRHGRALHRARRKLERRLEASRVLAIVGFDRP